MASAATADATSAASPMASTSSEPAEVVKSVLSKITEKESLIPAVIPDGSKVISSLFGKLSKFAVAPPASDDLDDAMDEGSGMAPTSSSASDEAASETRDRLLESTRKKGRCVSINVFYEDVFSDGFRLGQLHSSLESYAAAISHGPIDGATLSLVSRHYRNCFKDNNKDEGEDFDGIEPTILRDILAVILSEDTPLGLSLLLSHHDAADSDDDFSDFFKSTPGLGLYMASIRAALASNSSVADDVVFRIPPGLLYCWCKTLMYQNKLDDELFAKAVSAATEN